MTLDLDELEFQPFGKSLMLNGRELAVCSRERDAYAIATLCEVALGMQPEHCSFEDAKALLAEFLRRKLPG